MKYQELHQRYGSHIATRVQAELPLSEFSHIDIENLITHLETRAEAAHKEYQVRLDDPLSRGVQGARGEGAIDLLHRRWRDAEDLSYLVAIAEDVSVNVRGHR